MNRYDNVRAMHLTERNLYSRSNTVAEESKFFYYHTQQQKGLNSFYSYLHRLPIWARRKTKEGKAFKEDSPQKTDVPTKNIKLPFNLLRIRSGDTDLRLESTTVMKHSCLLSI